MEHVVHIGLGGNIEPCAQTLMRALKLLNGREGVSVRQISDFIQTEPVGGPQGQPKFMNAAALLTVALDAESLLAVMQKIEAELGRDRKSERRWGPRTCDLDMLLFDEVVCKSENLTLPHPRMHERLFVLEPLAQIAGAVVHPVLHKTVAELLATLGGK